MRRILPLFLLLLVFSAAHADEGMWRPRQLPDLRQELRALGSEIDPGRFNDLLDHPMNAVIRIPGCTASFVSSEGLIVTNHHCGFSSLQYNSDEKNNYVENGFLAKSRAGEIPARPGYYALVAVEITDVTDKVRASIPKGAVGRERYQAIEMKEKELVAECEKDPGHRCRVSIYHGGLEYELIKQVEIRDVRLVYAPPRSVGEYGGDIDNWMWPRHTGDWSFFRAYVGPDGKPADHSEKNVPYRPKHFLKVATDGVKEGSLVIVAGYPGGTARYRLAEEVESQFEWAYPTRERLYREWIETIEEAVEGNEGAAIKYSGLLNGLNNSMKNYGGMLNGYAKAGTLEKKRKREADLQAWIEASPDRKEKYGSAVRDLRALVAKKIGSRDRLLYYDYLGHRAEMLRRAVELYRLAVEKGKPDMEREPGFQERDWKRIEQKLERAHRSYDPDVDRVFFRKFVLHYAATVPVDQRNPAYDEWFGIDGKRVDEGRLDSRLDEMYSRTKMGDKATLLGWMEKDRAAFEASRDPFIRLAVTLFPRDLELEEMDKDLDGRFDQVRPRYMEAIIAYNRSLGKPVYPDANSTLRVTYGTVIGYKPRDAVAYTPFTSLEGLLEKETGEEPFASPKKALGLARKGVFGPYEDAALGNVPVNYLSTVDSTGGNSGSATLNARGELVGLLFDGVWESIIADWDFIPDVTRSIHVDSRYMLWVMDNVDGAHWLMSEMGIEPSASGPSARVSRGGR